MRNNLNKGEDRPASGIDISLPSPNDIVEGTQGVRMEGSKYLVSTRSVIMLHYYYAIEA